MLILTYFNTIPVLLSPGSGPQPADADQGGRDNPPITGAGRCDRRDSLTIRGPTERNPPLVCGTLTGQHSTYFVHQFLK